MICCFLCFLDLFFFGLFDKGFVANHFALGAALMLEIPFDFALGAFLAYFVEWLKCRH